MATRGKAAVHTITVSPGGVFLQLLLKFILLHVITVSKMTLQATACQRKLTRHDCLSSFSLLLLLQQVHSDPSLPVAGKHLSTSLCQRLGNDGRARGRNSLLPRRDNYVGMDSSLYACPSLAFGRTFDQISRRVVHPFAAVGPEIAAASRRSTPTYASTQPCSLSLTATRFIPWHSDDTELDSLFGIECRGRLVWPSNYARHRSLLV